MAFPHPRKPTRFSQRRVAWAACPPLRIGKINGTPRGYPATAGTQPFGVRAVSVALLVLAGARFAAGDDSGNTSTDFETAPKTLVSERVEIHCIAVSPDGKLLAAAGDGPTVSLRRTADAISFPS